MVMMAMCYIDSFMHYLGVDIGGTATKACLVDESGRIYVCKQIPTITNDLDRFLLTLTEFIADFQKSVSLEAVGIGVAGLKSSHTHRIVISPNIPCLVDVDLETAVEAKLHVPVVTENDAKAGAYAELIAGAGRGVRHMVYITLGTGLGAGIILEGQLFRGKSGFAGELGHTTIEPNGRICACGQRGCLETVVSASAIVAMAKEKLQTTSGTLLAEYPGTLTAENVFDACMRGDRAACEIFQETGRYLGIAAANLINFLNLERIVLGGGVMAAGSLLLDPARVEARRRAFPAAFAACEIVQSQLWPESGMIGAAFLARDRQ
jgi:glucokinase